MQAIPVGPALAQCRLDVRRLFAASRKREPYAESIACKQAPTLDAQVPLRVSRRSRDVSANQGLNFPQAGFDSGCGMCWLAEPMSWVKQPVNFVDFEGSLASGILEYGVVTLQDGAVVALRTRLCRATGRIRPEDTAVHGLAETALAGCAPFAEEFDLFADLRACGPFAAHFAGAENSLIKSVWPYGRTATDFARPGRSTQEWGPWIDTGALYRQFYPQLETLRLADLVAACGLQSELDGLAAKHCSSARSSYHAAPYDALAGALLLGSLAREPQLAKLTLPQLLALSTLDGGKRDELQQGNLF